MKKTMSFLAISLMAIILFVSCASANVGSDHAYTETILEIPSVRGTMIPATLTMPVGDAKYPLVAMLHGHGGSRTENGGFTAIANNLAQNGIAVIRMDFPGCGDSKESFTLNTLDNMVDDVVSSVMYVQSNFSVDAQKLGLFGYSMGGTLVQTMLNDNTLPGVDAVVLLAPAVENAAIGMMGGKENWDKMYEVAKQNGFIEFKTVWGQTQLLSEKWFECLSREAPLSKAQKFDGPSLVIYGEDDGTVLPAVSKAEAAAIGAKVLDVTGDTHSYGFYSDRTDIKQAIVDATTATFIQGLK